MFVTHAVRGLFAHAVVVSHAVKECSCWQLLLRRFVAHTAALAVDVCSSFCGCWMFVGLVVDAGYLYLMLWMFVTLTVRVYCPCSGCILCCGCLNSHCTYLFAHAVGVSHAVDVCNICRTCLLAVGVSHVVDVCSSCCACLFAHTVGVSHAVDVCNICCTCFLPMQCVYLILMLWMFELTLYMFICPCSGCISCCGCL